MTDQEQLAEKRALIEQAAKLRGAAHRMRFLKSPSIAYKESFHHHGSTLEAIARTIQPVPFLDR